MSPSEAMYVVERVECGWHPREQELTDAECMLTDQLEVLQVARRDQSRVRDMLCPPCRQLLHKDSLRLVSVP